MTTKADQELDARERRFVAEYLIDFDPKRAALTAGYSASMATSKAYQWVSSGKAKPHVFAAIHKALRKTGEKFEVTRERVIQELAAIGLSNMSDLADWGEREVAIGYDADGKRLPSSEIEDAVVVHHERAPFLNLRDCAELTPEARAAVSEVALTKDGFKIKMHDKGGALEKLGRHLGMFSQDVNINGPVTFVIANGPEPQGKTK